jgi:hypothetical protein
LSQANAGWLLGSLVVGLLVFGGWLLTRDVRGGGLGFALGVGAATKMNLFPIWMIVVIFGVGLALIVRQYASGRSAS